ncbi:MAG: hypothetical protein K6F39_04515 [Lachnospiraceae bacterium]|nr:hypothetical protein [Lachnospiraceae bacterium]
MGKLITVLSGAMICVLLTACGTNESNVEKKIKDKGYDATVYKDGDIRASDGTYSYYYEKKKFLFINKGYIFDHVEGEIEEKSVREDTDNKPAKFIMCNDGDGSVDIYLTFNEYFGGKDDDYEENEYHIPLKGGFGEDDLQTTAVADFEREYYILTKYYISGDELEDVYDRGLEILENLNK